MSDDDKNNNITDFDKEKKRRSSKKSGKNESGFKNSSNQQPKKRNDDDKPKLSKDFIKELLFRYLNKNDPSQLPYGFDPAMIHRPFTAYNYWVNAETEPRICLIDKEKGTAKAIGRLKLAGEISECLSRFDNPMYPSNCYCLNFSDCLQLAKMFMAKGRTISEWPKPIGFKTIKDDIFFKRHNFDPSNEEVIIPEKHFPTINLNLKYMTNSRNFCERIGSLYDPNADRKQMIFMVGEGDGGKSALINLLTFLAGGEDGIATVDKSVFSNFGLDPLLDKRVWIAEELSPSFFKDERYKILTGGSPVQINRKNVPQFNAYLDGILFCASNKAPVIDEDDSGFRNRIIICDITPIPKELRLPRHETNRRMEMELPYFIKYCMDLYSKVGGDGTLTPDTTESLEDLIAESEATFEGWFDDYFLIDGAMKGALALNLNQWTIICDWLVANHPSVAREKIIPRWNKYVAKRLGRSRAIVSLGRDMPRGVKYIRLNPNSLTIKHSGILESVSRAKKKSTKS